MIRYGLLVLFVIVEAEIVLRLCGYQPWGAGSVGIQVEPGGTFFSAHPELGYAHIPGDFTVTLAGDYSFHVSHLDNSLRVTRPRHRYGHDTRKEQIWIFGCSFTHGWSLNDADTYPWLLQERFPEYDVVNFGASGYGTVHSLIQFRNALAASQPRVAVLGYAGFHDERNTFLRIRAKAVSHWHILGPQVQPFAYFGWDGELKQSLAPVGYHEIPLMRRSALVHAFESAYNQIESKLKQSHAVSEALVMEMAKLAAEHQTALVVAGISQEDATHAMLDFAREQGIPSVDIGVDLSSPENTNLPYDGHPSAAANREYASRLEVYLRENIFK